MKILYCATKEIFRPVDGRCAIIRGRIDLLAAMGHEVHACLFSHEPQEKPTGGVPFGVHRLPLRASAPATAMRMALGLLPYQVALYSSAAMRRAFRALVEEVRPDVIFTDMLRTYPLVVAFARRPGGPKVVADVDDLLHKRYFQSVRGASENPLANTRPGLFSRLLSLPALAKLGYLWEGATLRRYAHRAALGADAAVLVSSLEADELRREVPGSCQVIDIPQFVDTWPGEAIHEPEPLSIGIMGNFKIPHNRALVAFFVERILPLVRRAEPGAVLHLLGSNPPPALEAAARRDGRIVLSGYIPDLRSAMARMAVASCYMEFGTGIKTKILEFMSLGVPVVASRLAMEGIPAVSGTDCIIEDDLEANARAIVRLLRDGGERRRIGLGGKALVEARFSRESVGKKLGGLLDSIHPPAT